MSQVFLYAILTLLSLVILVYARRSRTVGERPSVDPDSLRRIAHGEVAGFRDHRGIHAWLGLPFAAPPVGELRWRAPRPPAKWNGTREALAHGAKPAQIAGPSGDFPRRIHGQVAGSEDCLYLNVWAPACTADRVPAGDARLPVMVWIYGGGNATGAADHYMYDLSLLSSRHSVVCVSFNYRLGVFGWFRHPALHDATHSAEDRSGNFGTLDVIQALRWVRENIAAFGGDPENVTIFGESAGGINVITMLLSPLARGLFQRAICQSGVIAPSTIAEAENHYDDAEPGHRYSSREIVNMLLRRDGHARDRASARQLQESMSNAELSEYLHQQSAHSLLSLFGETMLGMYFSPRTFRDGLVLPDRPWQEVLGDPACYNDVPVIFGATRDELKLFMSLDTGEYVDLRFGFLPRIREPERYEREARYHSELWRAATVDEPALRISGSPELASPVFAYRFDWDDWPRLPGLDLRMLIGAGHSIELFFLFGVIAQRPWLRWFFGPRRFAAIEALSRAMASYWCEFARNGDPARGSAAELPLWSAWSADPQREGCLQLLDAAADGGVRPSFEVLTVERIKARLLEDPELKHNDHELLRLYARLFVYGFHGPYWDQQTFTPLADLEPGGARRALLRAHRPLLTP